MAPRKRVAERVGKNSAGATKRPCTRQLLHCDFAFLPREIINDVVVIAGGKRGCLSRGRVHHEFLIKLEGAWGAFARNAAPVLFINNKLVRRNLGLLDEKLTLAEAKNRLISHCEISNIGKSDFELLKEVAPNLYKSIEFFCAPIATDNVYDLLGDRFSEVKWEETRERPISGKAIEFLKRQLRSNHLRKLTMSFVAAKPIHFDFKLLADFVRKPTFEALDCSSCAISPLVLLEADKAWKEKTSFQVGFQEVSAYAPMEVAVKLKKNFQFPETGDCKFTVVQHPIERSATRTVKMRELWRAGIVFTLEFRNFEC